MNKISYFELRFNPDFSNESLYSQIMKLSEGKCFLDNGDYYERLKLESYHLFKEGMISNKDYDKILMTLFAKMQKDIQEFSEVYSSEDQLPF